MNGIQVNWQTFKSFVTNRGVSIQYVLLDDKYYLLAIDGGFEITCILENNGNSDVVDFDANFKPNGNKKLEAPRDSDGSPLQRAKITTSGWHYQLHGVEFKTSQLNSIVSNKPDGTSFGYATIKCYDSSNNELTTQLGCDTQAVKTVIDWEPTHDYEVVGGTFRQSSIPGSDIRMWVIGVPDVPEAAGGSKCFAANINLKFVGLEEGVTADGRAPKYMTFNAIYHTGKLRIVLKHATGFKHDMHFMFEIFKA